MPTFILEEGMHDFLVPDRNRIADSGEHVGDRVGDHYQDAFLTPGSSPRCASSRTQMRHMPKSRR